MIEPLVERLTWDSTFFGFAVGRLDVGHSTDVSRITSAITSSGCKCVYVFIPIEPSGCGDGCNCARRILESIGARCRDVRTTYAKNIASCNSSCLMTSISEVAEITPELETLAIASGAQSRFVKDEKFRPFFCDMYKEWLKKDLAHGRVFAHRRMEGYDGIATVGIHGDYGKIGLVAVDAESRGKGIATGLLSSVDAWLLGNRVGRVEVVTQGDNVAARRLYEKSGFSVVSQIEVWHAWIAA